MERIERCIGETYFVLKISLVQVLIHHAFLRDAVTSACYARKKHVFQRKIRSNFS